MTDREEVVFIVDDDDAVRKGLARLLRSVGYTPVTFACPAELLSQENYDGIGCIVLDVRMPGLNGMELQAELAARDIDLPIVFLTGHGDIPMSVQAMKQGAVDFLTKPVDERVLLDAVQQALRRHKSRRAERQEAEAVQARLQMLTSRELEVLRCVIAGARNKRIAAHLGIAEQTVKIHRARVVAKLGVHTWAELFQACQRAGIEPSPDL
jgi:FixJ family two-component response regulator